MCRGVYVVENYISVFVCALFVEYNFCHARVGEINDRASKADIHTTLVANGVIDIKRG